MFKITFIETDINNKSKLLLRRYVTDEFTITALKLISDMPLSMEHIEDM